MCALVTDATKRAYIDQAEGDGGTAANCADAAAHVVRGARRGLARVRVIGIRVRGSKAVATVNDAAVSDSGNDTFGLEREADGRWLVDDS